MPICRKHPVVYEIAAWPWVDSLSRQHNALITLGNVPDAAWDEIAQHRPDAVWLMGVWKRSAAGRDIARRLPGLRDEYRRALGDFDDSDVVGSPYAIVAYEVDERLGGEQGLERAREQLSRRGIKLLLDFVPNHVAVDHAWVREHPEYLVHGSAEEAHNASDSFFRSGSRILAHGRDPYCPPWTDTVQLNAFNAGLREAMAAQLERIASRCDGVRCDMAMLVVNRVFERTWGGRCGPMPSEELWPTWIARARRVHPEFWFLAEVYWDMEWELQQLGFDHCYDKRLYDRLRWHGAPDIQAHLRADLAYQDKLVRFIENHDERRALDAMGEHRHRAAAVLALTLPGAKLVFMGQPEGRQTKVPVQLGRWPVEQPRPAVKAFYLRLMEILSEPIWHQGQWSLCACEPLGEPDASSASVAWLWQFGAQRRLVAVNYGQRAGKLAVRLPEGELGKGWGLMLSTAQANCAAPGDGNSVPLSLEPYEGQIWGSS